MHTLTKQATSDLKQMGVKNQHLIAQAFGFMFGPIREIDWGTQARLFIVAEQDSSEELRLRTASI